MRKYYMIEDPAKVPPDERWPSITQEQIEHIREGLRNYHKDHRQIDGIWIEDKSTDVNGTVWSYFRLEDDDGYAMIFKKEVYTAEQAIEIFKTTKETDPDWNYGKKLKQKQNDRN